MRPLAFPPSSSRRRRILVVATVVLFSSLGCLTGGAAAQQLVLLAFGDSITHGLGDVGVSCIGSSRGYPPLLNARLGSRGYNTRAVTSGVCGELTSEGLSRIDNVLRFTAGDVLLLMEGTNDLSDRNISTESMRFNLNAMAGRAEDRGYYPVLAAPIPRDERVTVENNDRTAFLGSLLRQDALAKDWGWVPTFVELINIQNLYDRFYADPFHPNPAGYSLIADIFLDPTIVALERILHIGPCVPDVDTLCLAAEDRFSVEVSWTDFEGRTGFGRAVSHSDDTGFFWFFGPDNFELMIKILDGRGFNDHFWVFYGSLSSVGFEITVTDHETGRRRVYSNPVGEMASHGDTAAFFDPSQSSGS
ncbi:MAG: GDSL-type esterase/lipase family protein [Thermoanaerobaculia bacterium]|nr:GDSL-type esterase/lipase family protein [Thermoanaerobaculia bacterium]